MKEAARIKRGKQEPARKFEVKAEDVTARAAAEAGLHWPADQIAVAEVANILKHGFWLLLGQEELFVSFIEFLWFKSATIEQILAVEWPSPQHLYWPQLDIDLSIESIRNPAVFPLISRSGN